MDGEQVAVVVPLYTDYGRLEVALRELRAALVQMVAPPVSDESPTGNRLALRQRTAH